jgi:hypothetical protein
LAVSEIDDADCVIVNQMYMFHRIVYTDYCI